MNVAVRIEALKLRRSPVGVIATLAFVGGMVAILGAITAAVRSGDPQLAAKVGPGATLDWPGLLTSGFQITAAGGLLVSGVVLAWIFAREFTDGTITGLFSLPISRTSIALAKLIIYALWAGCVGVAIALALVTLGIGLGYGAPSQDDWLAIGRECTLMVLTAAVALPVAWVASATRSLLAGVGLAVGIVVLAQTGALTGAGGWMPLAAPALWAMDRGVTVLQLGLTIALAGLCAAMTVRCWKRLRFDR